jgi:hypothetical protein
MTVEAKTMLGLKGVMLFLTHHRVMDNIPITNSRFARENFNKFIHSKFHMAQEYLKMKIHTPWKNCFYS